MSKVNVTGNASGFSTLADLLLYRAEHQPSDVAYVFHDYSPRAAPGARDVVTFGDLVADAQAIASMLQAHGLAGESVLLLYGSGLEFVRAYCGCLLAGARGIPLRPPLTPEYSQQLGRIAVDARARGVLCPEALLGRVKQLAGLAPELGELQILASEHRAAVTATWKPRAIRGSDIALIQYTSGSTSSPKGVVVSHANLLHNESVIREAFGHSEKSVVVGWLPMFHDMGLIGNVLQPLYLGVPSILMDPLAFLQRPARWFQLITQYCATTSGGPNFGYELCVNRIEAQDLEGVDLSSWTLAFNGAEPVRMETMNRFVERFAPVGFRRETFYPCYGLAESTLFVAGIAKRAAPTSCVVDANALTENEIKDASGDGTRAELVSCGYARLDQVVRIVDPDTRRAKADDLVGEIWVAGESVACGYFGQSDVTRETFQATLAEDDGRTYLRTGDLGFLRRGELYVSGRLKDLIIVRGSNHYPHDIEATAAKAHAWLRPNCGAAFAIVQEGEERLILVHEVKSELFQAAQVEELIGTVRAAIAREHGLKLHDLVLVRARAVPKTSSGKLQRRRCRALYESGNLRRLTAAPALNEADMR